MVSMAVSAGSSLLRRKTDGFVSTGEAFVISSGAFVVLFGISFAFSGTSSVRFPASEKRGRERLFGEGERECGIGRFDGVGKGDWESAWMERLEGVESDCEGEESSLSCEAGTQSSCKGMLAGMSFEGDLHCCLDGV